MLKAVTEEGGEVRLGHGAGDLLQEELHLLLVRSHRRAAVGGKLHHGEKGAEQVALCVVVIAFHQLVAGFREGREGEEGVGGAGRCSEASSLRPLAHRGQLAASGLVVLLVDALYQTGDLVQGEAARVETHPLPPRGGTGLPIALLAWRRVCYLRQLAGR